MTDLLTDDQQNALRSVALLHTKLGPLQDVHLASVVPVDRQQEVVEEPSKERAKLVGPFCWGLEEEEVQEKILYETVPPPRGCKVFAELANSED